MALYNLIGHWRCSAVRRITASKCFIASILGAYVRCFVKVLVERNVNVSTEIIFSDVYQSSNYTGLLGKFT